MKLEHEWTLLSVGVVVGVVHLAPFAQAQSARRRRGSAADRAGSHRDSGSVAPLRPRAGAAARPRSTPTCFAPGGGYFFSNIRGEVTRESLILLVQSERHCNPTTNAAAAGANAAAACQRRSRRQRGRARRRRDPSVPTAVVEPSPEGAKGTASLGNAGWLRGRVREDAEGLAVQGAQRDHAARRPSQADRAGLRRDPPAGRQRSRPVRRCLRRHAERQALPVVGRRVPGSCPRA